MGSSPRTGGAPRNFACHAALGREVSGSMASGYTEASIKTLSSTEHIRLRPGMYIGRLGNGAHAEDGIYVLLKETIDNSRRRIHDGPRARRSRSTSRSSRARVRDYGRGIPLGKLLECVSVINTGAKYDSETFKKAVGLNGVGQKAVNALSVEYRAQAVREGESKVVEFAKGKLKKDHRVAKTDERNGTMIEFTPDEELFGANLRFRPEFVEDMLWNYAFLNRGLTLTLNGKPFKSENGLKDLLQKNLTGEPLYPIIHLEGEDIEIAMTHGSHYGEEYFSFVNGQHTTMGGHAPAGLPRGAWSTRCATSTRSDFDAADVRQSIVAAISVRVHRADLRVADQDEARLRASIGPGRAPRSRSSSASSSSRPSTSTSTRTPRRPTRSSSGSRRASTSARSSPGSAASPASGRRRPRSTTASCATAGCTSATRTSGPRRARSSSWRATRPPARSRRAATSRRRPSSPSRASRSTPTACRRRSSTRTRSSTSSSRRSTSRTASTGCATARSSSRPTPTWTACTSACSCISFFLQFFPELIAGGHLFILETPLFRVRNKKETHYCYSEAEKQAAVEKLGAAAEITRFKGLGEISAGRVQGLHRRRHPARARSRSTTSTTATCSSRSSWARTRPERQDFIIENLRVEKDVVAA